MSESRLAINIDSRAAQVNAENLARALADLERMGIRVTGTTSAADRAVSRAGTGFRSMGGDAARSATDLDKVDRSAKSTTASLGGLQRATALLGTAFSVRALVQYADGWSDMQSRIGAAIKDMEAAPTMMSRIVEIANASYSPLNQTVEIYGRNVAVLRDLGRSATEAADFTEALNHALVTTATKGQDADVVLNALSRSIAIGGLRSMEFETIMSRSPRVLEAIADQLGVNVTELRNLAQQGKATGDVIVSGLINSLERLRKEAGEMPATVGDAFVRVGTNVAELVGKLDQASAASGAAAEHAIKFADAIRDAGDNLDGIIGGVVGIAAAYGSYKAINIGAHLTSEAKGWLNNNRAIVENARSTNIAAQANLQRAQTAVFLAQKEAVAARGTAVQTQMSIQLAQARQVERAATVAATQAASQYAAASSLASRALGLVGGPLGALNLAVSAGAGLWMAYAMGADDVRKALVDLSDPLDSVLEKFQKLTQIEQQRALRGLESAANEAAENLEKAFDRLEKVPGRLRASPAFQEFKAELESLKGADLGVDELDRQVSALVQSFLAANPHIGKAREAVESAGIAVVVSARAVAQLNERLDEMRPAADGAANSLNKAALEAAKLRAGLDTDEWTKFIQKLEDATNVVGMSAQQLGEYQARALGASEAQTQLAGVLSGMADAAKKLEKATADKDTKAQEGAKAILAGLVQQEVQIRVNLRAAQEYAAMLAAGLDQAEASRFSGGIAEGARAQYEKEAIARLQQIFQNITANTAVTNKATQALSTWIAEQRVATEATNAMAAAYLAGSAAVSELTRQQKIEEQVLKSGEKARSAITAAVNAHGIALDRLDIAKQIDGLRQQNTQASAYLKVFAAQSQGYKTGVAALTAYNKQQALTELLVGKTADEVADLTEKFEALWDQNHGLTQQTEGMQELNRLVESTRTKQEAYSHELERLVALRPYAQTEEQARALERAIGDLQRENSVWFTFTEDAINRIDESFANMWRDWMDGSRSAFDAMKSGFKQMLAEMAHAAITRPIMISVGNAVMGTRTPGGIGDVWGSIPTGGGSANALSNGIGWLGDKFGSTALQSFAQGMAGTAATFGQSFALSALPATASWAGAAAGLSSAVAPSLAGLSIGPGVAASLGSGVAGTVGAGTAAAAGASGAAGLGAAFGAALPWVGGALAIGSLLGGSLFDSGPPKTRHGQRTTIDYAGGAYGISAVDDRQSAGSEQAALAAAQSAVAAANDLFARVGVNAGIESFYAVMESSVLGDRNGVASGGMLRIGDQLRQIGIKQSSDMTFAGVGGWSSEDMLSRLQTDVILTTLEAFQALGSQLPSVLSGMLEGIDFRNTDAATAADIAARFSAVVDGTTQFLAAIEALPFEQLRGLSFDAAAGLVQLAGGVEGLLSAQQTYYQAFYSEAERHGIAVNNLTSALAAAGVVMPEITGSTEQMLASYRGIVEAQDLTTEAGRLAYVVLMGSAGAFAEVAQYAGQAEIAVEQVADVMQSMASLMGDAVSAAYAEVVRLGQERIAELQQSFGRTDTAYQAYRAGVQKLESDFGSLFASIARYVFDLRGQVEAAAQMQYAQARAVISTALVSGNLPQTADLNEAMRAAQQGVTSQAYGSLFEQQRAYLTLANEMEGLRAIAEPQLDTEKATLAQLEAQYNRLRGIEDLTGSSLETLQRQFRVSLGLEEAARREITLVEQQLEAARLSVQQLTGVNDGITSLTTALLGLTELIKVAQESGADGLPSGWNAAAYLAKNPDLASYYQNNPDHRGAGSFEDWLKGHYLDYGKGEGRSFAVGTNYVPFDMKANIHEGERIIPAADNRELMRRLSQPQEGSAALVAEIRRLNEKVDRLQAVIAAGNQNTKKTADVLERSSQGGPLIVRVKEPA